MVTSPDNPIRAWWRLIRGGNVLLSGGAAVLGSYFTWGRLDTSMWLLVPLAPTLITAAGNIQNDLLDRIIDRLSHPDRPLVTGSVSAGAARNVMSVGYVIGLIAAAALSSLALSIAGVVVLGLTLYNLRLSRRPFVGNLAVAIMGALPVLYGGLSTAGFTNERWLLAGTATLIAFWMHLARELLKDAMDIEGDRLAGRRTLPMLLGEKATIRLGAVAMLVAAGFAILPWLTGQLGVIYLVGVLITVIPSLLFGAAQCLGRPHVAIAAIWSSWLKVTMLAGLVWMVLGVWATR